VLPKLYGSVVIPRAVFDELSETGAPEAVRSWLKTPPVWISIRSATAIDESLVLGRGEVEAICLAQEIHADEILLDKRRARKAAAKRHLLHLPEEKLGRTNFRIDPSLVQEALKRDAKRLEQERNSEKNLDREIER
jgi:hypothetical protein